MKCFRCENLNFDVIRPSLFGLPILQCSNCTQYFFVQGKLQLNPIELLGKFEDIERECIIQKCNFCNTKRYIAVDCTNLNLHSCGLCNYTTEPVGDKIPLIEFLNRSSSIDGDTQES